MGSAQAVVLKQAGATLACKLLSGGGCFGGLVQECYTQVC
jgi:hypothetical protein